MEHELDSDEESAPPEFDLRTGRYVSHTRPMMGSGRQQRRVPRSSATATTGTARPQASTGSSTALTRRANGDVAQIGGVVSPAAEFLRTGRTWQGLGSDFAPVVAQDDNLNDGEVKGARMEEGRRGVARGYAVGEEGGDSARH